MLWRAMLASVALAATSAAATAQTDFPNRAIKIIVPLPPGGTGDILPRIVAEKLSLRWGKPVIIENKPAGAQHIGTQEVFRGEPDGYTLLSSASGPMVVNPSLYKTLSYDPAAFVPVTVMASLPYVLEVNPKLPVSSVAELIAYARANPDKLNYASTSGGSQSQLSAEWLKVLTGAKITFVPYKGSAQAVTDLIAGHVDMMFDNMANSLQHIREGRLKALVVTSEKRLVDFPDLPTMTETYPGFVATSWFGLLAPPKTPTAIADKLQTAIAEILQMPDVVQRLRDLGAAPDGMSRTDMTRFIKEETERWAKVIAAANITID
jgi:tripartite-type tricarboxylate transporter receptor subunit TctC